jgi:hypothetical protein
MAVAPAVTKDKKPIDPFAANITPECLVVKQKLCQMNNLLNQLMKKTILHKGSVNISYTL